MSKGTRTQREKRWRGLVRRQRAGAEGAAEFCRREGLALSTFHWWRRRLCGPGRRAVARRRPVLWIETEIAAGGEAEPVPGRLAPAPETGGDAAVGQAAVRIGTGGGLWIEFAAPPPAEVLAAVVAALAPAGGGARVC